MSGMDGKVAIVTGGGRGIGAATCDALAARGVRLVVNYSKSAAEAEEVAHRTGGIAVRADVGDDADARALVAVATDRFGRLDMLVNNAGKTKFANHEDMGAVSMEDFLDIYRLNVGGAFQMIRAATPALRASGAASVVNVASIAGVHGIGSSVPYAASKGAMITMTRSLARVLAPEIRVNAICPGYVGTEWFSDRLGQEGLERLDARMAATTPLGIAGKAPDIAEAILMFLDDATRLVSGETLLVDAGLHLDVGGSRRPGRES